MKTIVEPLKSKSSVLRYWLPEFVLRSSLYFSLESNRWFKRPGCAGNFIGLPE